MMEMVIYHLEKQVEFGKEDLARVTADLDETREEAERLERERADIEKKITETEQAIKTLKEAMLCKA